MQDRVKVDRETGFFLIGNSSFLLTHGTDTSSGVKYFLEKGSIVVVVVVKSSQVKYILI